jgi:hypothetical protein
MIPKVSCGEESRAKFHFGIDEWKTFVPEFPSKRFRNIP